MNTFCVPVYARFGFDVGGLGVYALAGVQVDLLFGALKTKTDGDDWENMYDDIGDFFDNTMIVSLAGGAGVTLPLGPGILNVGAGITYGLTSYFEDGDLYPWGIDVQAAYGFSIF